MRYSDEVAHFDFSGDNSKETYLKACKWIAKNIVSKEDEFGDITFSIKKMIKAGLPTFRVTLYASLDESEENNRMCTACKEVHNSFFKNSEMCGTCRKEAFRARVTDRIAIKAQYIKERMKSWRK